ncbi:conserved hypothetical protein [Desulforamulus reducens MI-1]|uniref:Uncharacterized protein n=1 Tax=Desulforamulus reducens (strain ATCC BAA-1160 / DSM 100696 / MI-1) TaxID=349161 RepID=A4J3W4_DESRM|nr:DsrE family protein [Desulforamulus reducens]ABO49767.1 conserved hypothetical protein [Desulforamulus reducens MI-1]
MEKIKVLFHVSENEIWQKTIANITNYFKDVEENTVHIEVVANAGAVASYFANQDRPQLLQQMEALAQRGVDFTACRNALSAHHLDEQSLPSFVRVVSGGITEIVNRQRKGYLYIKP